MVGGWREEGGWLSEEREARKADRRRQRSEKLAKEVEGLPPLTRQLIPSADEVETMQKTSHCCKLLLSTGRARSTPHYTGLARPRYTLDTHQLGAPPPVWPLDRLSPRSVTRAHATLYTRAVTHYTHVAADLSSTCIHSH